MVLPPVSQAEFYTGPLWDAHSHVDEWTSDDGTTKRTRASNIAMAINGAVAGTLIWDGLPDVWPEALPGVGRFALFPKKHLEDYMLSDLVPAPALQNRLITAVGFQNNPSPMGANNGWREYVPSDPESDLYNPAEDTFLNHAETRAASGSYQWLGEVALYGKEGQDTEIKAELFDPVIEGRILRVLRIAARYNLPVTFHHTVTGPDGNPICNLTNPPATCTETAAETAAERFLSILRSHANEVNNDPEIDDPATVVWAHWGGLSNPQPIEDKIDIQDMIDEFPNLYFDLAWFHKAGLTTEQNRPLNVGCDFYNLTLCEFTDDWKALISSNPGRFLAGIDAGTNTDYKDKYRVRELILRTALGGLADDEAAESIAANNLKRLLGVFDAPADGDITLDGAVNGADVMLGQQIMIGLATTSPLQFKHGDVAPLIGGTPTPDDLLTPGDVLLIQLKALDQIKF